MARLQASIPTIAHQERPEYLDRLSVLREQIFTLDHMYMSVFSTAGWILRLGITVALLATVNPVLVTLVLFAIPTVAATSWRPVVERAAQERGAQADRLARHLFALSTTASSGKELRVLGIGRALAERRRASWERWYGPVATARTRSAAWYAAGWAVFALAYVGRDRARRHRAARLAGVGHPRADRGRRLSSYVGATVSEIGFLRGIWMDGSRRLAWLEDYASADGPGRRPARAGPPHRAASGSSTSRSATRDRTGPRSRTSTCSSRPDPWWPSSARTGPASPRSSSCWPSSTPRPRAAFWSMAMDLARIDSPQWRQRLAGAFQDFFRFEFQAGQTIGLGDLPAARRRACAADAPPTARARGTSWRLSRPACDTQLGPTWHDGVDVSFGQWQKLALARGFMRDEPLVVALDEPTAALDAETEHAAVRALRQPGAAGPAGRQHDHPRVAPVQHRPHGRPHRGARRRARRGGRQPRRADGPRRPVRRAVPNPGKGVPVTAVTAGRMICCTLMYSDVQSDHDLHERFRGSGLAA